MNTHWGSGLVSKSLFNVIAKNTNESSLTDFCSPKEEKSIVKFILSFKFGAYHVQGAVHYGGHRDQASLPAKLTTY